MSDCEAEKRTMRPTGSIIHDEMNLRIVEWQCWTKYHGDTFDKVGLTVLRVGG